MGVLRYGLRKVAVASIQNTHRILLNKTLSLLCLKYMKTAHIKTGVITGDNVLLIFMRDYISK